MLKVAAECCVLRIFDVQNVLKVLNVLNVLEILNAVNLPRSMDCTVHRGFELRLTPPSQCNQIFASDHHKQLTKIMMMMNDDGDNGDDDADMIMVMIKHKFFADCHDHYCNDDA